MHEIYNFNEEERRLHTFDRDIDTNTIGILGGGSSAALSPFIVSVLTFTTFSLLVFLSVLQCPLLSSQILQSPAVS